MSLRAAEALWGREVVARALSELGAELPSEELAALVQRKAEELRDDTALAQWALSLPWARFCGVVRIVSGTAGKELLDE